MSTNGSKKFIVAVMLCGFALTAGADTPLPCLSGYVYLDNDNSGTFNAPPDSGLGGVVMTLTGNDLFGDPVNLTTITLSDGSYIFLGLSPSAANGYTITEGATPGYVEGANNVGSIGGTLGTDAISGIVLNGECGTGYNFGELPQPCIQLIKTADSTTAPAGGLMGYTYTVTNCGSTTLLNVTVIDDAGTPGFLADDFTVGTVASLAPGQTQSFHISTILPVSTCVSSGGTNKNAGLLIVEVLASGDIKVIYRQSRSLNDNVYGTPSVPDGWASGHTFGNLTGSDKAEFRFTDGNGKVVLDFFSDYVSATNASPTFPAGYASLGPNGGDGSMVTGSKTNVLSYTSTLAESLNHTPPFPSLYTVNSPTPEALFPTWDYVDGYTVVVSKKAFGAAGFGGVTIPFVHNSPAKTGVNQVSPTNACSGCVTNIALAGINNSGVLQVMYTAQAKVCPGQGCDVLGACTPPYPFSSANPLTSIAFNESEVLRTGKVAVVSGCIPNQIQVFYNDEHALELGVRQVIVKTSSGKTTNNYPVAALTSNPGSTITPSVGSTAASGDQAGTDVSGRPLFPALFVTDITGSPSNPYAGDWQYGGTAIPPDAVFGTWKAAVRTVDKTKTPNVITLAVDADPAKNNWNLGPGSDPVPAGLVNEGYGAEVRWDISKLGLLSGHTYRLYFMVHDGDQNKTGGDSGQACGTVTIP